METNEKTSARTIGFRAYYRGTMYGDLTLRFENGDVKTVILHRQGGDIQTDKAKLLQATGLKDKSGKEIFEGDIVTSYGTTFTVVWKSGTGCYELCGRMKEKNRNDYYEDSFILYQVPDKLVIGNIYQNPELLEHGKAA